MSDPNLLFTMRLNKARHDKAFQGLLAVCFGEKMLVIEDGFKVIMYQWRGMTYVTQSRRVEPPPEMS